MVSLFKLGKYLLLVNVIELEWIYLPHCVKHSDQRKKSSHQQNHPSWHDFWYNTETAPGYDDKERGRKVALEEVASQFSGQLDLKSGCGVRSWKYN